MASLAPAPRGTPSSGTRPELRRPARARRVLWVGSISVLLPLAVLFWLQYRWLQDLERTSTIAQEETLDNYLGVIVKEVKIRYWTAAQGLLTLPAGITEPAFRHKIPKYFRKRFDPLARRLFVVDFNRPPEESLQFYDPQSHLLVVPEATAESSPELAAVQMAIAPWRVLHQKGGPADDDAMILEQKDREHRMLLKPLLGPDSRVTGLVGMILDQDFFLQTVLPEAIEGALPELAKREQLQVSVRDDNRRWVLGEPAQNENRSERAEQPIFRNLTFVFTDWRVYLTGSSTAPRDWARANFAFNLSLTMLLSALVIGGLALLLRATSREMHLSEMKNDFVSNVSHELRTPLASIRVFGELLRLGKVKTPEKVRQYGDYIEAESRRLTQLIDNILDFSRIESGRKEYSFETVDLGEVVQQMLETWQIRLRHQGFVLHWQGDPGVPPVRADRDAMGQALFNLIDNAVKYSGDSKRIELSLRCHGDEATLEVTDHGIGISRTEQKHIFDRFHRVGSRLTHDVKGSGLGLALVQHIAAAHGGRVDVRSSLGQGSTFTLYLPLAEAGAPEPVAMPSAHTA